MTASASGARADAGASDGSSNGSYSDDYVTEMLAWIATATQEDLEKMDQQRHDAIFGKHQTDKNGKLLYLDTVIEDGKEVEKVSTNATNSVTGEPNLPYYDNTGSQRLYEAYQARMASLVGDNPVVRPELVQLPGPRLRPVPHRPGAHRRCGVAGRKLQRHPGCRRERAHPECAGEPEALLVRHRRDRHRLALDETFNRLLPPMARATGSSTTWTSPASAW